MPMIHLADPSLRGIANMKITKYIVIVLSIFFLACCTTNLKHKFHSIPNSNLGVHASDSNLDELEKLFSTPPRSKTGKSLLTLNKMGFDVLDTENLSAWLLSEFTEFIKEKKQKTILDVGCGYGRISHLALAQNHKVIANDLMVEHLVYVRKAAHLRGLNMKNLYLKNAFFPNEMEFDKNSLDAVVLYRVIHFLSPEEIENGLAKIYTWLKPGGKVFIVVLAPQHKAYSDWFLPIYNARWESGDKWPGNKLSVHKALPAQEYNLPKYLHVMDDRPLKNVLEKHGFRIKKSGFVNMSRFSTKHDKYKRDGNESFGIIAEK